MLKEKLGKALKKAGLNEELANVINITSEDQIEGVINQLKSTQSETDQLDFEKVLKSSEFTKFVQDKGFDSVLKLSKPLQSEHDKKVTQGIKTFKDKYFKNIDPNEDDLEEKGGKTKTGEDDTPAWAKALIADIESIKKKDQRSGKLEQAETIMKKSKLPESLKKKWIGRIDLESETSFEDQVEALEEEYGELHQSLVGENSGKGLPLGGSTDGKATEEEVEALADDLM